MAFPTVCMKVEPGSINVLIAFIMLSEEASAFGWDEFSRFFRYRLRPWLKLIPFLKRHGLFYLFFPHQCLQKKRQRFVCQTSVESHRGHWNSLGHLNSNRYCKQASSESKRFSNSRIVFGKFSISLYYILCVVESSAYTDYYIIM